MSHDDFAFEPVRGLPGYLPPGERLIWQGAPDFRSVALRTFHIRKVAIYFGLLVLWRMAGAVTEGDTLPRILMAAVPLTALGTAALALLSVLAWLVVRTTVYSITSRRVVMRIGVALPITFNLPFAVLGAASLKLYPDHTGNVSLALNGSNKLAYFVLWPHARPWRLAHAEPTLRLVADARRVAQILAEAVVAFAPQTTETTLLVPHAAPAAQQQSWPIAPVAA